MSAGTLTLTNKSAAVSGSGTAFTTELAAGDFIVVTVGGIPYTLPVKTVNSNTSLTLVSNFTGPTQSGAAWYAVPRIAMNLVTAAVVTQAAEALRGLNYDKQNWQQVFSGTGNVTVKLPDGNSFTGPAWGGIVTILNGKAGAGANGDITSLSGLTTALSIDQGGTGAKIPRDAAVNLKTFLNGGTNIDRTTPTLDSFVGGQGSAGESYTVTATDSHNISNWPTKVFSTSKAYGWGNLLSFQFAGVNAGNCTQFYADNTNGCNLYVRNQFGGGVFRAWAALLSDMNTVKDTNGFIKAASPVVKLFADGSAETNEESQGVTVTRLDVGEYLIEGCMGLNADASWGGIDGGFDIPTDRNQQPRIWLDYKVNADGSVLVRTYHRVHSSAPEFAQNRIGNTDTNGVFTETVADSEPVDIPADSFVSVRVEMPEDSIWNQKKKETREAMEKAERERQQNQPEKPL